MSAAPLHPPVAEQTDRVCVICGDSLDGRRPDALTCGAKCRRERSRLLALLGGGSVSGGRSVAEYLNSGERACEPPPKIGAIGGSARATRTARAGAFIEERCLPRPGQLTIAAAVYAAYLRWCEDHEPEAPLSRSAFDAVLARRAPIEDRVSVASGGRGRPRAAIRGIVLVDPAPQPTGSAA